MNNRPLTHVSVDPEEPEALTPNHFLFGGSARTPLHEHIDDKDLVGRATWRTSQRLVDLFWSRWVREYLPTLQDRREPYGSGRPIELGDVVLVADGNLLCTAASHRCLPRADEVTRVVDVRARGKVLRRAVKKLVILPTEPVDLHTDNIQHSGE